MPEVIASRPALQKVPKGVLGAEIEYTVSWIYMKIWWTPVKGNTEKNIEVNY